MSTPKPCPYCTKGVETDPAGETHLCGYCDGAAVEVPLCTAACFNGESHEPCTSPGRFVEGTEPRCWIHAPTAAEAIYPLTPEAHAIENRCGYCKRGVYEDGSGPEVCPYCDGAAVAVPLCGHPMFESECDDAARLRVKGLLGSRWRCPTHAGDGAEEVYPRTAEAQALWDAT